MGVELGSCRDCRYGKRKVDKVDFGGDPRFGNECYSLDAFVARLKAIKDANLDSPELLSYFETEMREVAAHPGSRVHFNRLGDGLVHPVYCRTEKVPVREG